jgi:hypothetical protein
MTPLLPLLRKAGVSVGRSVLNKPLLWVIGALIAVIAGLGWANRRAHAQLVQAGLAATNAIARADTSRALIVRAWQDSAGAYHDSALVYQRAAVQERQRADGLDRALGQDRVALASLTLVVDSLRTGFQVASESGGRLAADSASLPDTASWHFARDVWTADLWVHWARTPEADLSVHLAPPHIEQRFDCGPPGPGGVRPASLNVTVSPAAYHAMLGTPQIDPAACNAPLVATHSRFGVLPMAATTLAGCAAGAVAAEPAAWARGAIAGCLTGGAISWIAHAVAH